MGINGGKTSILIVDDKPENLTLLSRILMDAGYQVRGATSGLQALKTALYSPPQLILLDIKMPDMDGYEVCRQLKVDEWTRDIPVIFLSSLHEAVDKVKGFRVGGADFISKPFSAEEVLARVQTHCDLYAIRTNLEELVAERTLALKSTNDQLRQEIAERKEIEKRLAHAEKLQAIGELTGGVAHDFNNLLGIIMGNAELLEDGIGENGRRSIEAILRATDRGAALTARLLAFSRKQALAPLAIDLTELIDENQDMLQRTLGEAIDVKVENVADLWHVIIDPGQFENALLNLTINARDAMPDGGVLVIESTNFSLDETYAKNQIEVTPGDYVKVSVSDTGAGIDSDVLDKVFDPFFTTKDVGSGSGLGLSMVFGFVKQSGGHITIYSEVGHGTTVNLYLPRSKDTVAEKPEGRDTSAVLSGSECILVVENDHDLRSVPVEVLRARGYEVFEAENGEQAVDLLNSDISFQLLFTDVVLPGGMNGVEISRQAVRLQPDIKVLYTTGYAENAVVHGGKLDAGVQLINKPYRGNELLEKIRSILDSVESRA